MTFWEFLDKHTVFAAVVATLVTIVILSVSVEVTWFRGRRDEKGGSLPRDNGPG